MTYGPAVRDLFDALGRLIADSPDPRTHLGPAQTTPDAHEQSLARITRLRGRVVRALTRMTVAAAVVEAELRAQAEYERHVEEKASRLGTRAGAAAAAALASPHRPGSLKHRITAHTAATMAATIAQKNGTPPSSPEIADAVARRTTNRVADKVKAGADLSDARRLLAALQDGRLTGLPAGTELALRARELDDLARRIGIDENGDGDLVGSAVPVVAAWQSAARAAILLTDRELPAMGLLTGEQLSALVADTALVRDALTLIDARWRNVLKASGGAPWDPLPRIPASGQVGDHPGLERRGTLGLPSTIDTPIDNRLAAAVTTLGRLTTGLSHGTPHARAAERVASTLTRICHDVGGADDPDVHGTPVPAWTARASTLDSLWLELQDVHSGAGGRAAARLADQAAQVLGSLTGISLDDQELLLDAVDRTTAALCDAIGHATRTNLYTVVTGYRPGPVVRAIRRMIPTHRFATARTAPKLFVALGAVQEVTQQRPLRVETDRAEVAGEARARLVHLTASVDVDVADSPSVDPTDARPAPPSPVIKIYRHVRDRVAGGTYTGTLPSATTLAHRFQTTRTAARQALARLAADRAITISPPGAGHGVSVPPAPRTTWADVYRKLHARVTDGTYTGRLPSTSSLAAEFGVSTTVIHTAAAALARDGLVVRIRGPHGGTFTASDDTPEPPKPRWRTISDDLRAQITDGQLTGRLPAMSALAAQYATSVSTVHRAIVHLTTDGIVYQRTDGHRSGTFVLTDNDEPDDAQWRTLSDALRAEITTGLLHGRLPTPGTIARKRNLDPRAAVRAIAHLVDAGLVGQRTGGDGCGLYVLRPATPAPEPVWRGIYSDLRDQITDGTLHGRLPSRRDLARTYGTSTGPPGQAMRRLADEGLVTLITGTGPTAGAYTAETPPPEPNTTPWTIVYNEIRACIDDGTYTGRLPRVPDLAAAHHTTRTPVYKALRQLAAHGRVVTVNDGPRSGTYVTPAADHEVRSRRWTVYTDLRERITTKALHGRLPNLDDLAREYGTSRKPIRYAVSRLASEGLIDRQSGRPKVASFGTTAASREHPSLMGLTECSSVAL